MDENTICATAREVILTESEMIIALTKQINRDFVLACEIILNCQGRVIVMGMGKSGHIAKKIAATMASTGTPAFFIHPAEAKHGDFGMITGQDVVLALSNSGETEEIISILPFIKRLQLPLIAMTGNANSSLAKASSVHIHIEVEKEACPLGLAPTSSTTAALVMGDAIAISLLKVRGFTAKDFAFSHPGGALGRKLLLTVDDLMHKDEAIPKVSHRALLKTALMEITQKKLGMTTVVDEQDKLSGIFTDGDVRRAFDNNADVHQTQVNHLMTLNPKIASPTMLAHDALMLMENHKITSLVITNDDEQPVGVVHLHDILRAGIT